MKPTFAQRLSGISELGGLVDLVSRLCQQLFPMLSNGLTFEDNFAAAWVDKDISNATATLIANPLKGAPKGVFLAYAAGYAATSPVWSYDSVADTITVTLAFTGAPAAAVRTRLLFVGG